MYALFHVIINSLLQNLPNDVTGRMVCAHTFTTFARRIYLMTAEVNTTAQFRNTNAAAGMGSANNVLQ